GHRPVQDAITVEHARTTTLCIWENCLIPGMVQTPDYARAVFTRHAQLMRSPKDTEEAVRARVRRQEALYDSGKRHRILMWEGALRALVCSPAVLAAQLDRLVSLIGLDTVASVADSMYAEYKEPLYAAPPLLQRMVDAGGWAVRRGRGSTRTPESPSSLSWSRSRTIPGPAPRAYGSGSVP
ncbi:hypothetical protein DDE05_01890, partial [Streptomyces cavourensis]